MLLCKAHSELDVSDPSRPAQTFRYKTNSFSQPIRFRETCGKLPKFDKEFIFCIAKLAQMGWGSEPGAHYLAIQDQIGINEQIFDSQDTLLTMQGLLFQRKSEDCLVQRHAPSTMEQKKNITSLLGPSRLSTLLASTRGNETYCWRGRI